MPSTHCNLLYHIVFSTKERTPVLKGELHAAVHKYLAGIVRGLEGVPLEIGGVEDHVHILAKLKPTLAISDALRTMKTNSSKWINDERRRKARFEWQVGYAAFSVSESQVVPVRRYIRNQKQHHREQSFQEEFVALLDKHGIEYDPRYLWD